MTTFTPGPWTLRVVMEGDDGENLITETYNEIVAGCGYLDDEGGKPGFSLSGCIAKKDAHLIAAAPDMYEFLREIESQRYVDRAKLIAILNKAEGREP